MIDGAGSNSGWIVYAAAVTVALAVALWLLARRQRAAARLEASLREEAERRTRAEVALEYERSQAASRLATLQEAKGELTAQFEILGQRIFEDKAKRFAEQNRDSLGALLSPLGEQIKTFAARVDEVYDKESKERFSLASEVRRLAESSLHITRETENLTKALKGSAKTQGSWGELVLETVLEASGLRRGEEYLVQASYLAEDGTRSQPDVVVKLPDRRCVVIDSKVSLSAYERYSSAEEEATRAAQLKLHLESLRNHVRGLAQRRYEALPDLVSPDFVLMFVPIESAFVAAVDADRELGTWALRQNVLIVCPTTLLATVRLVAQIWGYERQNRNAKEIARLCGQMYDKLVGFVGDLEEVGRRLGAAQRSYEDAHSKLHTGRGSLIRTAERVRELGVKPQKSLPGPLLEAAADLSADASAGESATAVAPRPDSDPAPPV